MMLKDKRVTILGLGITGYYMAKWALANGAMVTVSDLKPRDALDPVMVKELSDLGVSVESGGHGLETLLSSDIIIPSPGVPTDLDVIGKARAKGIPILGELDICGGLIDKPVIAITGTNGKSTVTTHIGEILRAKGYKVFVGGNLGTPVIKPILEREIFDLYVLEISSFQLDLASTFSPHIAIVLNITPDHLDRYPSFSNYVDSKLSIFKNQKTTDYAIVNWDDPVLKTSQIPTKANILRYSFSQGPLINAFYQSNTIILKPPLEEMEISVSGYRLFGRHNLSNLFAVIMVGALMGMNSRELEGCIGQLKALPHRMELVAEIDNRIFIDDSKATNVDAVVKALEGLDNNVVLILGGRHKGAEYTPILEAGNGKIRCCILMGEASGIIASCIKERFQYHFANTMKGAVELAYQMSKPGDMVLLSPGCSSFDMFKDYKDRGDAFRKAVMELKDGRES